MDFIQHLTEFHDGDGVGNDAKGIQGLALSLGWKCRFFADKNFSNENPSTVESYSRQPEVSGNTVQLFHYAGSGVPAWEAWMDSPSAKILRFHNFTPSYFFKNTVPDTIHEAMQIAEDKALLELASFRSSLSLSLCDSHENARVLQELGYKNIAVLPIAHPLWLNPNHDILDGSKERKDKKLRMGFVGRIVPNKKIEDLIFLAHAIRSLDKSCEFQMEVIGNCPSVFVDYKSKCEKIIFELGLQDHFFFRSGKNDAEMKALVNEWDFFISMSEHEGFGIPVLEAFYWGIPVLAYSKTAIPETMNGGGILFLEKDFIALGELILYLFDTPTERQKILDSQNKAIQRYKSYPYKESLQQSVRFALDHK